jgi:glycosyltransferase involved in cell wall biosynthesis
MSWACQAAADLSVVICSLNGAAGLDRCLRALERQTGPAGLQIIVVDDGSTDDTSSVALAHGATVIRHPTNRGLAAARNSGIHAASAPIVAFLDDDCEPEPQWVQGLLDAYGEGVIGVGGIILPYARAGFMLGYLTRHNPLAPLEIDLAKSEKLPYRLYLYFKRQWGLTERHGQRDVYSLVGANMSFRRTVLRETGFDERFRFGAEDLDLCLRLARDFPDGRLVVTPDARVKHHFISSLRDTLRRSRSYGRGCARLYRKWPSMRLTIFPAPTLVLALMLASVSFPWLLAAAVMLPHLMYPQGLRLAVFRRRLTCAVDPYVELAEEAWGNVGYVEGLWRFRHLIPEAARSPAEIAERHIELLPEPRP